MSFVGSLNNLKTVNIKPNYSEGYGTIFLGTTNVNGLKRSKEEIINLEKELKKWLINLVKQYLH